MNGIKKEKKMSRESILNAVRKNKPEALPLPEIDLNVFSEAIDLIQTFKDNIQFVGGRAIQLEGLDTIDSKIKALYPKATKIVSCTNQSNLGTISITDKTEPHGLESLDLAIIKCELGVAENGAVWIEENDFTIRVLPFITNDLVLIVNKEDIHLHLHDAYETISKRERTFGLFLSGPSKTADIEQCLVIGAQGAISLTVLIL